MDKKVILEKAVVQTYFLIWPFLAFVLLCILYFAGSSSAKLPDTAFLKIVFTDNTTNNAGQSICNGDSPQFYLLYLFSICEGLWLDRKPDGTIDQASYPITCCSSWDPSVNYNLGRHMTDAFPPSHQPGQLESDLAAHFLYIAYTIASLMLAIGFLAEGVLIGVKGRWIWFRLCYHSVTFLFLFTASIVSTTVMDIMMIKLADAFNGLGVDLIRGTTFLCLTWGAVIAMVILLTLLVVLKIRTRKPEET